MFWSQMIFPNIAYTPTTPGFSVQSSWYFCWSWYLRKRTEAICHLWLLMPMSFFNILDCFNSHYSLDISYEKNLRLKNNKAKPWSKPKEIVSLRAKNLSCFQLNHRDQSLLWCSLNLFISWALNGCIPIHLPGTMSFLLTLYFWLCTFCYKLP